MKLHLPSKLRRAVLACMAAMVGITTTCATGALVAGAFVAAQAQAADENWNATQMREHLNSDVTISTGNRVVIANGTNDRAPNVDNYPNKNPYGSPYEFGHITVEDGGQLFIHSHTDKSRVMQFEGVLTLEGNTTLDIAKGPNAEATARNDKTDDSRKVQLYFEDGSYQFTNQTNVSGNVYTFNMWAANLTFTNLTSLNDVKIENEDGSFTTVSNDTDILTFGMGVLETRRTITLTYNKDKRQDNYSAYSGTIVLLNPYDDNRADGDKKSEINEAISLVLTSQDVIGRTARYVLDTCTALYLNAAGLNVPTLVGGGGDLRNKVSGSQIRQYINTLDLTDGGITLNHDGGSTIWTFDSVQGYGSISVEHNDSESYTPSIVYLNTPNITEGEKEGFQGQLTIGVSTMDGSVTYGQYQNYVELGHKDAMSEATLYLANGGSLTETHEYSTLALNAEEIRIGDLRGSTYSLVMSGRAPLTGTPTNPSTNIRPESYAGTRTLFIGNTVREGTKSAVWGEVLKNVNLVKEGAGYQLIANFEDDSARSIMVKSGTLEIGSIGDFRRLNVENGAQALVGITTHSQVKLWGPRQAFYYFEAGDSGLFDVDPVTGEAELDPTKVTGNVIQTDKLYYRPYTEDWQDPTIKVVTLTRDSYSGDSVSLVGGTYLAVFNPLTGQAADMSNLKKIALDDSSALVSAAPVHFVNLFEDPGITIAADLQLDGTGQLIAHGSLYTSPQTGELTYQAYNTTYTGAVKGNGTTSSILKNGYGTVTLAGDMSEYNAMLNAHDGTLILSGSHGKEKNFTRLLLQAFGKASLHVTDGAVVTTETLRNNGHGLFGATHKISDMLIEKGSSVTITGENSKGLNDAADLVAVSYVGGATFLLSNEGDCNIEVNGTLTMSRASFISVKEDATRRKELNINDGGVFNAKGLWLQTHTNGDGVLTTINIKKGATLNLGADGLGHVDVNGKGQQTHNNNMLLTLEDGATLGVLDNCDGWSSQRNVTLEGMLTVNTQGYDIAAGNTQGGSGKTIHLGVTSAQAEGTGITKLGKGTLDLGSASHLNTVVVKEGYLSVAGTGRIDNLTTETNGSLLFDLTVANVPGSDWSEGQELITATKVNGTLNVTVMANGITLENPEQGKFFTILDFAGNAPTTPVNLVALVDDGFNALYTQDGGYGKVQITSLDAQGNQVKVYGSDDLLLWQTTEGVSSFWANSTETNWKAEGSDEIRRFTNYSDVEFAGTGEAITILGTVYLNKDAGEPGTMTVSGTGYAFMGEGSIVGENAKMVVEKDVTFANTGLVDISGGVELKDGATLRLEYLAEDASNWEAPVYGDGVLEIAAGGVRANVLESVMHATEKVTQINFDNYTTLSLTDLNLTEAEKLASAEAAYVKDGSSISIATGETQDLMDSTDTLYLAGAGSIASGSSAALSVAPKMWITYDADSKEVKNYQASSANVQAKVELKGDTTIYIDRSTNPDGSGVISGIVLSNDYKTNGYTLTKTGGGTMTLTKPETGAATYGAIRLTAGSLNLDFAGTEAAPAVMSNKLVVDGNTNLVFSNHITMKGGMEVNNYLSISGYASSVLTVDSSITGENGSITLGSGDVILSADNSGFEGTWIVNKSLELCHEKAAASAVVTHGITDAALKLGAGADHYTLMGLTGAFRADVTNSDAAGTMKTLEICGNGVYESRATIGKDVSLLMTGRGAQRFAHEYRSAFVDDYNGTITVQKGQLQFRTAPSSYDRLVIDGAGSQLAFGTTTINGASVVFSPTDLTVSDGHKLYITQVGGELNANLLPRANGQITLGSEATPWLDRKGLSLYGQRLALDTNSKAKLTVHLSAFQSAGDYVDLFTEIGKLTVNGTGKLLGSQLGVLGDFFVCDDINLANAPVWITDAGSLRIQLTTDSDGLYYAWNGGDGEWNTTDAAWATKDDAQGIHTYEQERAAYFTGDTDAQVRLTEDITAREMAVKNGSYVFELEQGNDLTIKGNYYEMQGGEADFLLKSTTVVNQLGESVEDGAVLTIEGGMGDITNTSVIGDGSDANRLILSGETRMSENAAIRDVDVFLNGADTELDFGDTTDSRLKALNGEGTVAADGATVTLDGTKDSVFVGKLLATDVNTDAGANTLIIEGGSAGKLQKFTNGFVTDGSWNVENKGNMLFEATNDSKLHSLTLGAGSLTTLTVNTDQKQLLGLSVLSVDDAAKLVLNSTGNAPIMSGDDTPGMSYTVLGTFADDGSLTLGANDSVEIELGSGAAYLMVDKTKPITLNKVWNDESGYFDLVLKATVDDSNKFAPYAGEEENAVAGADMMWSKKAMSHISAKPEGDLARTFSALTNMVTATTPNGKQIQEALAAVAGSSTAVLGSAFSADVERQLKAIRNRTTTMGVSQCEVNENMPYYNAWINGEGNHRELSSDGLAAGYTHDSWGGTVGFDVDMTPKVTMGLALTAMYGDIESDAADKAEGTMDTMYLSAFARYASNAWVHTFVATVGRADVTLDRTVKAGDFSYETKGETDGMAFGFMYEVGRVFAANEEGTTCWQPVVNVAFRSSSISGYEEEGSDAGLSVGDQDFSTLTFGAGARFQSVVGENLYNRASIFEARALVKFDAGDTEGESTNALLNGDGKGHKINSAEVGAVGLEIGAGLTIPVGAYGGAIFVDASADLRSGYTNINGTVGYRVNF